jgi:hypothetical protein
MHVRWQGRTRNLRKETRVDGEGLDSGHLTPSDHRCCRRDGLPRSAGLIGSLSVVDVESPSNMYLEASLLRA